MGVLPDWLIEQDVKIEPFAPQQHRPGVISYGVTSYGYDVRLGYVGKIFSPIGATVIDPKNFDPKALVTIDLTPNQQKHNWTDMKCEFQTCKRCGVWEDAPNGKLPCGGQTPDHFIIPPHSFMLGESLERFDIPRDVLCVVLGKSTYARCGLIVNVTPGEPEWQGHWTIELSNTTPLPIKVYAGEGIMQAMFFRSDAIDGEYRQALFDLTHGIMPHMVRENLDRLKDPLFRYKTSCRTSYADKKGKYQGQAGLTLPKVDPDGVSATGS